jgi:hypothetical protein
MRMTGLTAEGADVVNQKGLGRGEGRSILFRDPAVRICRGRRMVIDEY